MAEIATINFLSNNTSVIDLQNFVTIGTYKNSSAHKNNITFLKDELMLMSDITKAIIHVFHRNKWEEEFLSKKVLPSRATAICASFGKYLLYMKNLNLPFYIFRWMLCGYCPWK